MVVVAGRNRVNRPFFMTDVNGERVEFPAFGTGQGDLEGNELRMFRMYVSAKQIELMDVPEPQKPDAFGEGDWSISFGVIQISNMPDDHGSEITSIAVRVDGDDITVLDASDFPYLLDLDPGEYDIDIAAISDAGQGDWSDVKNVTMGGGDGGDGGDED